MPDSTASFAYREILDALERLRVAVPAPNVFGSGEHRFRLNPPMLEAEVAEFEDRHHIRLPDDYRGFLVHVGNGGAGPAYGLFKLGEIDNAHKYSRWKEEDGFVGILSLPFPHTQAWNELIGKPEFDEAKALAQTNYEYEDDYGERLQNWHEKHYWNTRFINGAIPICHLGCAYRQWLVICGPEAGHVWCDDRVDEKGLYPLESGADRRTPFLRWYRTWLDESLKSVSDATR